MPGPRPIPGLTICRRVAAFGVLMLVGLIASAVSASGAMAVSGQGSATPYKTSFDGATRVSCSGARIVNSNTGMVKDSETCRVSGDTSFFVAGTYTGDPYGTVPGEDGPVRWVSDFDGAIATQWKLVYVDNGDGTWTVSVVAYY
jgi:hypothetical protein